MSRVLESAVAGRVRAVFTSNPDAARVAIVDAAEARSRVPTMVSIHWSTAPRLDAELTSLLEAVAEAARVQWPRWYSTVADRLDRAKWPAAEAECRLSQARTTAPGISEAWFRKAWQHCQAGRLPIVSRMSPDEQLRQLAMALDPGGLVLVLAVSSDQSPRTRVMALGRAAEWLAARTGAPTLLVIPEAWSQHPELDCVNYDAISWNSDSVEAKVESKPTPSVLELTVNEPRVTVEPAIGGPNPNSVAERRLHEHLTGDAELGPLFRYNMAVTGFGNKHYRADVHWPEGRVVIEIDGPDHWKELKYSEDRERDYRLLLAGFQVLRVTNSEVIVSIESVLEKIRNVVRLRRESRRPG